MRLGSAYKWRHAFGVREGILNFFAGDPKNCFKIMRASRNLARSSKCENRLHFELVRSNKPIFSKFQSLATLIWNLNTPNLRTAGVMDQSCKTNLSMKKVNKTRMTSFLVKPFVVCTCIDLYNLTTKIVTLYNSERNIPRARKWPGVICWNIILYYRFIHLSLSYFLYFQFQAVHIYKGDD